MNIGIDIEEVARFQKLVRNKRFLEKVFTEQEIRYCKSKKNPSQHFAVRFSAKEAAWKALSEFLHKTKKKLSHRDIGVKNNMTGKPEITLPREFLKISKKLALSLSHTRTHVVAVAVMK